jgi:peptide/nickel transport system substrate-binding protein
MTWQKLLALLAAAGAAGFAGAAVVAGTTGATAGTAGGELRAVSAADVGSLDPALVDDPLGWDVTLASCSTLFVARPDSRGTPELVPEAAVGIPTISHDGLTYTFAIRSGLRFADSNPLTAAAYARAIGRVLDPRMHAPAAPQFASAIASVHAHGSQLVIHLTARHGDLLALLTMPWACPIPAGLPIDPNGIDMIPGSGPYTVVQHVPGQEIVLQRNPFYKGPRRQRPAAVSISIGGTPDANVSAVENGTADVDLDLALPTVEGPPPQLIADLSARYGVGKRQFFVRPIEQTIYLALNTAGSLFHDNAPLRRAVNYALDRPEIIRQNGPLAGLRTDQLLPPATLGFHDAQLYPLKGPDFETARQLARGHLRNHRAVLYVADAPAALRRAAIIRYDLDQIGLDVQVRPFARAVLLTKASTRGEPFDLALTGWVGFTPDPADFLVRLLDGDTITPTDNFNLSYFDDPTVNQELAAADALPAPQRYAAFTALETKILRKYAPVAPIMNGLAYILLSRRVHCFDYDAFGGFDLGSACIT